MTSRPQYQLLVLQLGKAQSHQWKTLKHKNPTPYLFCPHPKTNNTSRFLDRTSAGGCASWGCHRPRMSPCASHRWCGGAPRPTHLTTEASTTLPFVLPVPLSILTTTAAVVLVLVEDRLRTFPTRAAATPAAEVEAEAEAGAEVEAETVLLQVRTSSTSAEKGRGLWWAGAGNG